MATLPLKASREDGVLSFVFSGLNNLAPTRFNQKCIQYGVTSIVLERQYMFGVKNLLRVEKVLLRKNDLAAVLF